MASNIRRFEDGASRMLRDISASTCISFGTDAPYALGYVGFARVGFADIPRLQCVAHGRTRDISLLVPVIRQHLIRAAVAADLDPAALGLTLHWQPSSRERVFVDENPSSASHGKRKRGAVIVAGLDIGREFVPAYRDALRAHYGA